MNKDNPINITKKILFKRKKIFFFLYTKMGETTYYRRNRETVLNRAKDYYENIKEVLRKKAENKYMYRESSEEEKNIKREYGRNRYKNVPEEKKQRLKEYQKNYHKANKN